jgi:hypothetical protein
MYLHKQDIEKISNILKEFPDVETFELNAETSSGIGTTISMTFAHTVNGIRGAFAVEVNGMENW